MPLILHYKDILDSGRPRAVDEKLQRTFRVRKAADFLLLFRHAKGFRRGSFLIRCLGNQHAHARLGISVAKKRVKLAVKRNRIKRLARETFRKHHSRLPAKDYMVIYIGKKQKGSEQDDSRLFYEQLMCFWEQEARYHSK